MPNEESKSEGHDANATVGDGHGSETRQQSPRRPGTGEVFLGSWTSLENPTPRRREQESRPHCLSIGYFLYDVCYSLVRCVAMFTAVWLASHDDNIQNWKGYLLLCISILFLDAAVKDYWYASLKMGCKCTCRRSSAQMHQGRSIVV